MQNLWNTIKWPTYKSCKKQVKVQVTGLHNIFHKIIAEKFPNHDKERVI
jgi:hypothetical protein